MSIIHEALKKAGQEKGTFVSQTGDPGSIRRNLELEYQKKKSSSTSWGLFFAVLAIFFVISPILAALFAAPVKRSLFVKPAVKAPVASQTVQPVQLPQAGLLVNRKAQFGLEETPLFSQSRYPAVERPALALSGIVYSTTDSYCIINNKIVKIGDEVDGAKLVSISLREVILEYHGEKVTLAVSD